MAKYIKQEMKDLNGSGQHRVFYRIKRRAHISTAQLAQKLARGGSGLSEGDVYHVLLSLGGELAVQLAEGNSVTLEGIGTFFASIGVVDGKVAGSLEEAEQQRNAQSLEVKRIKFKADKELVCETNRHCELSKLGVSRLRLSPYTEEERKERARQYLTQHHFMRVEDYRLLTGLSRTSATLELQRWREDASSGITTSGKGKHIVYVLR